MANISTKHSEREEDPVCPCCCCVCQCTETEYKDLTCCGCFPVKCGIYAIGIFAVMLCICIFAETFMMLLSDHITWWFVLVSVLIQIPLILGLVFFLNWFGDDSATNRGKLDVACYLGIISFVLQVVWNVAYFWGMYKQQQITLGNDETWYSYTTHKKTYLFWSTFIYVWIVFAYGYFICVSRRYWYRLRNRPDDWNK